jgi:hypothetical protein
MKDTSRLFGVVALLLALGGLVLMFNSFSVDNTNEIENLTYIRIYQGNMLSGQDVILNKGNTVTKKLMEYNGTSSVYMETGTITQSQKDSMKNILLNKYHITSMKSDPAPLPEADSTQIEVTINNKKYSLLCSVRDSDCTKLASELLSNLTFTTAK